MYESFSQDHPLLFSDWKKLHDEEAALKDAPAPVEAPHEPVADPNSPKSALKEWMDSIAAKEEEASGKLHDAFKQLELKFEEKTHAL